MLSLRNNCYLQWLSPRTYTIPDTIQVIEDNAQTINNVSEQDINEILP